MTTLGFCLFETAIGDCAVAWSDRGLVGVQLPEADAARARARMRRRFPNAGEALPPPAVAEAIAAITAHVGGETRDFSFVDLDMEDVTAFRREVYAVARATPSGATTTYGEIAAKLGAPREAARDVGEAMGKNPYPIVVPCHRVLAAGGKLGGFSAAGGAATKLKLLEIEGARIGAAPSLFGELPRAVRPAARR